MHPPCSQESQVVQDTPGGGFKMLFPHYSVCLFLKKWVGHSDMEKVQNENVADILKM